MNFGHIFMVDLRSDSLGHIGVLLTFGIIRGKDSNMLHDHLIGLGLESIYFESAEAKHFVRVLPIVNGDNIVE